MYVGKKTVRSMSVLPKLKTKTRGDSNIITRHILRDEDGKIITGKAARKTARARGLKAKAEEYEEVVTDKPFLNYEGSCKDTEGLVIAAKEILYQCNNKRTATYLEAKVLFDSDALTDPIWINSNILGSFFDNCLDGLIETEKET
jgi:poly-gamma-glutamate capsule biosynthesis protein CapA/YwtB (metallophosphatase superfamily)